MEDFFIYLIKSIGLLAVFYACYRLLLANETFFTPNRHFLLAGVLVSFLMPLYYVTKTVITASITINSPVSNISLTQTNTPIPEPFNWWLVVAIVYGSGVLFFLGKFLMQMLSLVRLIMSAKRLKVNAFTLVETDYNTSPFSFFNYIVYNPKMHQENALQTIIAHEKAHAIQKHSADILLMHLVCIAQWFNPVSWWYKKAAAQNLEYIADAAVTKNMPCKKEYQYLLLHQSKNNLQPLTIINPFFNSLIKKRIVMINQQKSKSFNAIKYTLAIPFLAVFLLFINTKTVAQSQTEEKASVYSTEFALIIDKNSTLAELERECVFFKKKYGFDLSFYDIKRNNKDELINIKSKFKHANGRKGTYAMQGTTPIKPFSFSFKINDEGIPSNFRYGATDITRSLSGLSAADKTEIKAKANKIIDNQPIVAEQRKSMENYSNIISAYNQNNESQATISDFSFLNVEGNTAPLYIIDGIMQIGLNQESLNPANIESINIWKDKLAIEIHDEKAKNGVVVIKTKKHASKWAVTSKRNPDTYDSSIPTKIKNLHYLGNEDLNNPLILIDGEEKPNGYEMEIIPKTIERIIVLKDTNAIDKYGKKDNNEVIEIDTKKGDD